MWIWPLYLHVNQKSDDDDDDDKLLSMKVRTFILTRPSCSVLDMDSLCVCLFWGGGSEGGVIKFCCYRIKQYSYFRQENRQVGGG